MGWASYFEDISERALDSCPAVRIVQDRFRTAPSVCDLPSAPASQLAKKIIMVRSPETEAARLFERIRQHREIHVLCLSELRPKPQIRPGIHISSPG